MPDLHILLESLSLPYEPATAIPVFASGNRSAVEAVRDRRAAGAAQLNSTGATLVPALKAHLDRLYPSPDDVVVSSDLCDTDRPEVVEAVDNWLADQGWRDPEARAAAISLLQAGAFGGRGRFAETDVSWEVHTLCADHPDGRTLLDHAVALEAR